MSQEPDNKIFLFNLLPRTSKAGNVFYTGRLNGLNDIMGFVKEDGKIVLWAKMNAQPKEGERHPFQPQARQQPTQPQQPTASPPQAKSRPTNYAPKSKQPDWDEGIE